MNQVRIKLDGLFVKGLIRGTDYNLHYNADISREPCVYCGNPSNSWEHVIPRSWDKVGQGLEFYRRVRACAGCNRARSSKPLLMFLLEKKREEVNLLHRATSIREIPLGQGTNPSER